MPDRIKAPLIKSPEEFEIQLPECEKATLTNGVQIFYIDGGAEDVLKVDWVFWAGNYYENKDGIAGAVSRLLKSGTSEFSAFEINRRLEFYGAFLSAACYSEYAIVTLEVLSKHFREVLPLVASVFTDAVFPEAEISIYKQNTIQQLRVNLKKSDFVANREIRAMLYGENHPYGRKTTIDNIDSLDRRDLTLFYADFYKKGQCRIFAAGRLTAEFLPLMDEYFGHLTINNHIVPERTERNFSTNKQLRIENDKNGVQASIRIARSFPGRKHPDFMKAMVLNALLGGYFGSRLMSNIREEKGYTYGIYSFLQNQLQYSSWVITTEAGVNFADATVTEVFKELERLRREPASDEEMNLVRNYLIGHQLASLDGPFQIINRWEGLSLNDLDERFFYDVINTIKAVTPAELQELANKYFNREEFIQLTVI